MIKKEISFTINLVLAIILFIGINGQAKAAVWQWSIPVKGGINKGGPSRAFLWIPADCAKLRGVVLAQNNMEELSIIENKSFRDSLATIGFGVVWVSPAFDGLFNVPAGAGKVFTQMMVDLASVSGYNELKFIPIVAMGHSATSNFPHAFAAWFPERALCGVSVSGTFAYDFTNIFAPNTWDGRNVDFIPSLVTMGEYEGAGDSSANFDRIFNRRQAHPFTPMSLLPCAGEYHFATSQKKTDFIAYYIKKASHYRLVVDATDTSFATLKPIDPTATGWLVDRWRKNKQPRFKHNPVAEYKGIRKESFWCFDEDMAKRIEAYENAYYGKQPFLLAYEQQNEPVPQTNNHVQVTLKFVPVNDSLDFELSSSFLDTVAAVSGRLRGWAQKPVGSKISHPANSRLSVIDRTIGPFVKLSHDPQTGITRFRMQLEPGLASVPTNYRSTTIFSLANPGDARYKPAVLQADMSINVINPGTIKQTINFPKLDDVKYGTETIVLNGTSDKGLPVQYYVLEGPAEIANGKIHLTAVPPGAKFPVRVTVVAWQWGRNKELAAIAAKKNLKYGGETIETSAQVERAFYINK